MSTLQKVLVGLILTALTVLVIATWGSMGSIILLLCLIAAVSFLLLQKFLINRAPSDFQMEV